MIVPENVKKILTLYTVENPKHSGTIVYGGTSNIRHNTQHNTEDNNQQQPATDFRYGFVSNNNRNNNATRNRFSVRVCV